MGITVSKERYAVLQQKAAELFDKKTADSIVRHICRSLCADYRWVPLKNIQIVELETKGRFSVPKEDFEKEFGDVKLKREKGVIYQFHESKELVVKGWHSEIIRSLKEEKIDLSEEANRFAFEQGQMIIKTNTPSPNWAIRRSRKQSKKV